MSGDRPSHIVVTHIDITARKLAELALSESEERYRTVVSDQTEVISRFRTDGTFTFVNEVYCRFFGKSARELIGQRWTSMAVIGDLPMIEDRLQTLSPVNPVVVLENRVHAGSGEVRWMQFVNRGVFDGNGRLLEVQSVGRDVTERRRAEEALRLANAYNRRLIEASLDPLLTIGPDGRITDVNAAMEAATGYGREHLIGGEFSDCFTEPDRARAGYRQAFREGTVRDYPLDLRNRSGAVRSVLYNASVFTDESGRVMGIFAAARDITERRRSEEALEALRAELKAIYDHAPVMLCVLDRERRVLYANRMFAAFSGASEDALRAGHACGVFGCINAATDPRGCGFGAECEGCALRQALGVTWSTGKSVRDVECRFRLVREGIPHEVVLLAATTRLNAAKEAKLLLCLQDITEYKRTEEALQALSRRLLTLHEEERRLLARELHDEVGQLLTGLKLTLEMAASQEPDVRQDALEESSEVVGELIRQVRELSLTLRPSILDDLGLLPALLWQFERYTARTQIHVAFEHAGLEGRPCPPEVETAAYRIIQEALTNVVRHAHVGAVRVWIRIDGGTLVLWVEDHGRGFEPDLTRIPGATSGLAGMRERVRLLGGRLRVVSAPGAGTRIEASLPIGPGVPR